MKTNITLLTVLLLAPLTAICGAAESPLPPAQPGASLPDKADLHKADLPDVGKNQGTRYNVLFIAVDDLNDWVGCLGGHPQAITPNLDRLAKQQAMVMNKAYCPSTVCCPSRSALLTGMRSSSTGVYGNTQNLKNAPKAKDVVTLPEYFGKHGYHTLSAGKICWRNPKRKAGQPFFQVDNSAGCHESYLHRDNNTNDDVDPATMKLAAYHPDIPQIRMDYARNTAGVMRADKALGKILAKLEADGLAEVTIVIYTSDHGGIIGRSKRFLYDSGTRAALIVRIPEKFKHLWPADKPGARIDRLISFIDMPKTWLPITGSAIPPEMQGNVFLGEKQDPPREYVFMARERMDEVPDMQRAVRDKHYLYIRNYEPFRPNGQYLEYLWKAPSMKAWEAHHKAGKTDSITGAFFRPKETEELFDYESDPDNVKNLAHDPAQAERLARMRKALGSQQTAHHDCGFLPEGILVHRTKTHRTTIYDLIRNSQRYDQPGYMKAADVANFAEPADLPKLVELLGSSDEGYRYWGVMGCIQLGKQAATPEVLSIMKELIKTDVKDERTLDVRVKAAFYFCRIEHHKDEALRSLAEVITSAEGNLPGKARAWANIRLLGAEAKGIASLLSHARLNKKDQDAPPPSNRDWIDFVRSAGMKSKGNENNEPAQPSQTLAPARPAADTTGRADSRTAK